jgi:hypothetical protein
LHESPARAHAPPRSTAPPWRSAGRARSVEHAQHRSGDTRRLGTPGRGTVGPWPPPAGAADVRGRLSPRAPGRGSPSARACSILSCAPPRATCQSAASRASQPRLPPPPCRRHGSRSGSLAATHLACEARPSHVNVELTRQRTLTRRAQVRTADAPLHVTSNSRQRLRRASPSAGWALAARGRGLDGRRWAVCVSCGAPFRPRRRDAWFCSRRCQRSALRARSTTRRCPWCRQEISDGRTGRARFCSDRCRKRAWRAAGDGGVPA